MTPDRLTAALFGTLSRLRGKRIFHPFGVGFEGTLLPVAGAPTGARIFDAGEPARAIVRLSRSAGIPEALGDPCGLAFRMPGVYGPGRDQDLLLVSSAAPPVARHLILPARGFASRFYSTLLPYRLGGELVLIGAVPAGPGPGPTLAELRETDRAGMRFRIVLAGLGGTWREVAELELGTRLPDGESENLRLDPMNSAGGLEPAGYLNRLRRPAYRASQDGRGAAETSVADTPEPVLSSSRR